MTRTAEVDPEIYADHVIIVGGITLNIHVEFGWKEKRSAAVLGGVTASRTKGDFLGQCDGMCDFLGAFVNGACDIDFRVLPRCGEHMSEAASWSKCMAYASSQRSNSFCRILIKPIFTVTSA